MFVHSPNEYLYPSHCTSRSFITTPHFSCRVPIHGCGVCYLLNKGHFTWDQTSEHTILPGITFTTLNTLESFSLPSSLWFLPALCVNDPLVAGLATSGQGTTFAFDGASLHAVESIPDRACSSGRRLIYTVRTVPHMTTVNETSLACEWRQTVPPVYHECSSFSISAVKWLGPWSEHYEMFVATDMWNHVYHRVGDADTSSGNSSLEHVVLISP